MDVELEAIKARSHAALEEVYLAETGETREEYNERVESLRYTDVLRSALDVPVLLRRLEARENESLSGAASQLREAAEDCHAAGNLTLWAALSVGADWLDYKIKHPTEQRP